MLPYWLLFALWSLGAIQAERKRVETVHLLFFVVAASGTALMIGLRNQVGGDWGNYQRIYDNIAFLSLGDALTITDAGFAAVNWVAAQADFGVTFVNLVCAILFMGGFARLAWHQPNPALAVLIAVPYFIIVVSMGYTRQAAAIGLICYAISDISERNTVRIIVLIGIAALFHKTAVLMLPLALVPVFRKSLILGLMGGMVFIALFAFFLRDTSDAMVTTYVQGDYDSQGALVRVSMNVVAGAVFLIFRKRIDMPPFQKSFWVTCSLLSLLSLVALMVATASSGIDRISLYIIPLQIVTYSRIPYSLSKDGKAVPSILLSVVFYSLAVQFIWLNYADNANSWLPYSLVGLW